jgi:hypothetical protein
VGIKTDRSAVTPTTDSLAGGASLLRGLGDKLDVKKPPSMKVETKYDSYKPSAKGAGGSFPAEVTTDVRGAKVIVKGTPKGGTLKDITSVRGTVPVLGGAGSVGLGTEGGRSSIVTGGIKVPVGRTWSFKAETSALSPNDGTKKGVVTTAVGLTATAGASDVKAEVKLVDAQEPGKSKNSYALGVSVPLRQKDQAIEAGVGYENNRSNARNDVYSAKVGYKFGSDRRIDVEVTTGAQNGTTVQGRINIDKL